MEWLFAVTILCVISVITIRIIYQHPLYLKRYREERHVISNPRPTTVIPITIICGNCCGDSLLPRRTLFSNGRCQDCGSTSFVFASEFPLRKNAFVKDEIDNVQPVFSLQPTLIMSYQQMSRLRTGTG